MGCQCCCANLYLSFSLQATVESPATLLSDSDSESPSEWGGKRERAQAGSAGAGVLGSLWGLVSPPHSSPKDEAMVITLLVAFRCGRGVNMAGGEHGRGFWAEWQIERPRKGSLHRNKGPGKQGHWSMHGPLVMSHLLAPTILFSTLIFLPRGYLKGLPER